MLDMGLLREVREFYSQEASKTAVQAIGYKELKPYIDGDCTLEEACDKLKMETRRYAKRQLTWFRKNKDINWLFADELTKEELVSSAYEIINKHR
jgi:tRNA dimethylallyltransferase